LTEFQPDGIDLQRQIQKSFRFGPVPVSSLWVEMIVLPKQAISALSAFAKTRQKERIEFALDFCESHLPNLLALRHLAI
jgi:hypothetical protein